MDFQFSGDQRLLKKTVRDFAERELKPHAREWDEKQEFPREIFRKLGELGLLAVVFPEDYGGSGMSTVDYTIVIEELARIDAGVALSTAAHNSLSSGHIFLAGTEEQKKKYLPKLATGEFVGAWGLTENSAGSDAGGTRTTAVKDGDSWVLNGSKTFITNGQTANLICVVAKTDPALGAKGTSLLFVETDGAEGFEQGPVGQARADRARLTANQRTERELGTARSLLHHLVSESPTVLYALRLEKAYARFLELMQVEAKNFPDGRSVWRNES